MADSRDSLSLSLDDILAAAHKLAAADSAPNASENSEAVGEFESQAPEDLASRGGAESAAYFDISSAPARVQSAVQPVQVSVSGAPNSGFNFVFEPEVAERLESIIEAASANEAKEPARESYAASRVQAEEPQSTQAAATNQPTENRRQVASTVMTGIVSEHASPAAQPPQEARYEQAPAAEQPMPEQPQQQTPTQQQLLQAQQLQAQLGSRQAQLQQQTLQQQAQHQQQQASQQQVQQQPQEAQQPQQQQPQQAAQYSTEQAPAQVGSEPLVDLEANIDVISSLPAIPRAFTGAPAAPTPTPAAAPAPSTYEQASSRAGYPATDMAQEAAQDAAYAGNHAPSLTRQAQRAAQRAAEIAAGQREPNGQDPNVGAEGRPSDRTANSSDPRTSRSSTRSRRSNSELASQAEVRSWEQAGVQRAALEFLKNSRREYGKIDNAESESQPYPADSGFTRPIKLNPVEATSAVSEARKAEAEQKVFVNSQAVVDRTVPDSQPYPSQPAPTPATPIDLQNFMPMSAPIDPDNNDMSWVDAGRPEWTDLPNTKQHRKKRRSEPEAEPVREEKKKRQRKERATMLDKISEDEQFRSALTNGTSFSEAALDEGVASSIDDRMRKARKKQRKQIKRRVTAAVVVCLLGAGIGVAVGMGYYPVSIENGQVIFGDNKLVLGDKQSPSSTTSPNSTNKGTTNGGDTTSTKKPESVKDQTGTVIYGYTLSDPAGEAYTVTETVEFGSEGFCGNSTTEATFTTPEAAAEYLATVQRDYGKSFVGGSNEGTKTTVTVDVTSSKLDREQYEDALRNTVADLMIIKKS